MCVCVCVCFWVVGTTQWWRKFLDPLPVNYLFRTVSDSMHSGERCFGVQAWRHLLQSIISKHALYLQCLQPSHTPSYLTNCKVQCDGVAYVCI